MPSWWKPWLIPRAKSIIAKTSEFPCFVSQRNIYLSLWSLSGEYGNIHFYESRNSPEWVWYVAFVQFSSYRDTHLIGNLQKHLWKHPQMLMFHNIFLRITFFIGRFRNMKNVNKNLYYLQLDYLTFLPSPASLSSQASNYKYVPCTKQNWQSKHTILPYHSFKLTLTNGSCMSSYSNLS